MNQKPVVAVQMYTLRDMVKQDMAGALKEVAAMGYPAIETAGYGNLSFEEMKSELQKNKLQVAGYLSSLGELQESLQQQISEAKKLGSPFLTVPYLTPEWRTEGGYTRLAHELDAIGEKVRAAGLKLCYHNHAFEFESFNGKTGMDLIYGNSNPQNLHAELDTYWVQSGGEDTAAYITRFAGRVPILHIKDMAADEERSFAEIGTGTLDWPAIFDAAEKSGVTAYVVEQDTCPGDPFESLRISLENLKAFGKL